MKISVVVVAKNEEEKLPDCLESVKFCDEIVVVDDVSTDRTIEVAKEHNARVFERKLDDFAKQKNYGIDKSSNDWVLILDADERVSDELANEIQKLKTQPNVVAYNINFRNYLGSKWLSHGGLYPDPHLRLFNKKHARYGEKRGSHEMLEYIGRVDSLKNDIIHLTYGSYHDYLAKVKKYAHLESAWAKPRRYRFALKVFLAKYIKEKGFLDGFGGLVSATLLAYYQIILVRYIKKR